MNENAHKRENEFFFFFFFFEYCELEGMNDRKRKIKVKHYIKLIKKRGNKYSRGTEGGDQPLEVC
jgi:hypothetical protein